MELKNTKLEVCKKCWGTGNVHGGDENSAWSKTCADCHGIGYVRVPMTNADRIRAMSDEELAEWMARTQITVMKDVMNLLRIPCDEPDDLVEKGKTEALQWLKQPAE